ncbi:hypothetical protein HMPREF1869_01363, partial [Bacteroidales bacterium KA00251]
KKVLCHQDIKGFGDNKCYALRYKGTKYQSAWKYEYVTINNYQVLRITSRNVGGGLKIEHVAKEDFWQQNQENDIVRIFPESGYWGHGDQGDLIPNLGSRYELIHKLETSVGSFWSNTYVHPLEESGAVLSEAYSMDFQSSGACVQLTHQCGSWVMTLDRVPVRLFEGAGPYQPHSIEYKLFYNGTIPKKGRTVGLCVEVKADLTPRYLVPITGQLSNNEYTLSLKKGDPSQLRIEKNSAIRVKGGSKVATFILRVTPKHYPEKAKDLILIQGENPLHYVAKYNIGKNGIFTNDEVDTNVSSYWSWRTAVTRFSHYEQGGQSYHLPSKEEWQSIIPRSRISLSEYEEISEYTESVKVGSKEVSCRQEFKGGTRDHVVYGLRFKGTFYQSAWRYEWIKLNGHPVLRVTSINVEDGVSLEDITKEQFWQQYYAKTGTFEENPNYPYVVRIFPASGYAEGDVSVPSHFLGEKVRFWSSSNMYDVAESVRVEHDQMCIVPYPQEFGLNVRLFRDKITNLD